MRKETLREQVNAAEKRVAHCRQFIERQSRFVEDSHCAGKAEAEQLARKILTILVRVRLSREAELERLLRKLSLAS
jgi:hypothetical protein